MFERAELGLKDSLFRIHLIVLLRFLSQKKFFRFKMSHGRAEGGQKSAKKVSRIMP